MKTAVRADALWRPYTQHALADEPLAVSGASGSTLVLEDGRRLFDAVSSWWVTLHGHAHPKIAAAVAEQAGRLEQALFADFTHEPARRLAEGLLEIAPAGLSRVFLSDDGSTAVEAALKMAVGHWAALEGAYHGDTFGAMSASARGTFTAPYASMLFDVLRLPLPVDDAAARECRRLLEPQAGRLAALIVEPLVLGAAGMRMYPPRALAELRRVCSELGILFIADEVMTGFGRTGTMFACQAADVSPDILCCSKGITGGFLPLGATLATEEVFSSFLSEDRARTFFHGHSYTGNPIACAAAVASLEVFKTEPVLERIARIGAAHERHLARFAERPEVAQVRRRGTIAAIELAASDAGYLSGLGPRLRRFYIERGVYLRPLGNVVYMIPPYCSTEEELAHAYRVIEESLALLAR